MSFEIQQLFATSEELNAQVEDLNYHELTEEEFARWANAFLKELEVRHIDEQLSGKYPA